MTDPRRNECVLACQEELEAMGLKGSVEHRGKHLALVWSQGGQERSFIVPATPSDRRSALNSRSDIRRVLRQGVEPSEVIPFRPKVNVVSGEAVTNSKDVAEAFDKRHDNVLRDIDNLLKNIDSSDLRNGLFRLVMVPDAQGIQRRSYEMTRDGFALLAMGFTGAKAVQFKLAYIDAFNAMEGALRRQVVEGNEQILARVEKLTGDVEAITDLLLEAKPEVPKRGRGRYIRPSVIRRMRRAMH